MRFPIILEFLRCDALRLILICSSIRTLVNALSDQRRRILRCTPLGLILICSIRRNLSSMRFPIILQFLRCDSLRLTLICSSIRTRQCAFRSTKTNFALHSAGIDFDLLNSKESFVNALSDPTIFAMRCAEAHFDLFNSESLINARSDPPRRIFGWE